jgi:hypothetical protein
MELQMTLRALSAPLAAAMLLALAAPLAAQDAAATPPRFDFAAADTDADGFLSLEEWRAYLPLMAQERRGARRDMMLEHLFTFDADGDGLLSRAEIETAMAAHADERGAHRMQRARAEHNRWGGERQRGMREGSHSDRMFERIDADGDGRISPAELDAASARWAERAEGRQGGFMRGWMRNGSETR